MSARLSTDPTAAPMRRLLPALLAAAALVLSACAPVIPTDGPVGTTEPDTGDDAEPQIQPQSPGEGADADSIIEGFIQAGVGPQDEFSVAREYLTPELADSWRPAQRTWVYSADPVFFPDGEDSYTVQMEVEAVVDADGIMTPLPEGRSESFDIEVEERGDEVRISQAPDFTMIDSVNFNRIYASHTLYFYDPQYRYAVPDQRWFASRAGTASRVVAALLDGPAPYLDPAVSSAFPEGAALEHASVPIDDGRAEVDLESDTLQDTSDEQRRLMEHQLDLALTQLNDVSSVEVSAGQRGLEVDDDLDPLEVIDEPVVTAPQVGVLDGQLGRLDGYHELSIPNLPDLEDLEPQQPAVSEAEDDVFAFLDGEGERLFHVRSEGEPQEALAGESLTRPSMDNFGWTWTASDGDDAASVHALPHDDETEAAAVELSVDWLDGVGVSSLRISQDGARAAIVLEEGDEHSLYVAGVIRDSSGVPYGLGSPIRLPVTVDLEEARWIASDELVVWAPSDDDSRNIERVSFSGTTQAVGPVLLGLQNVSVGEGTSVGGGQRQLFAETVEVPVQVLPGQLWSTENDVEMRDYSYPG
ncbi:LpqB family beta-propeller domain-containing protein [Nesterenkonia marinintestina]|uniref:LpqB family beta-propeller domain-containing protein n=1 Tax=Nesterenkonia marinintestina TaxID=2979865 RepID=UPI0021BE6872|nr:LpqB family beta-propeller domain-containing protein [Nesterenkonia sp. GX14115]